MIIFLSNTSTFQSFNTGNTNVNLSYADYNRRHDGKVAQVAYVMSGSFCIYSGCVLGCGSTINYAEQIRQAIMHQEGRKVFDLALYDLQTSRGYGGHKPHEYEFERVEFDRHVRASRWIPTVCPDKVLVWFTEIAPGILKHGRLEGAIPFPFRIR